MSVNIRHLFKNLEDIKTNQVDIERVNTPPNGTVVHLCQKYAEHILDNFIPSFSNFKMNEASLDHSAWISGGNPWLAQSESSSMEQDGQYEERGMYEDSIDWYRMAEGRERVVAVYGCHYRT